MSFEYKNFLLQGINMSFEEFIKCQEEWVQQQMDFQEQSIEDLFDEYDEFFVPEPRRKRCKRFSDVAI